jgi:hypothetical protein
LVDLLRRKTEGLDLGAATTARYLRITFRVRLPSNNNNKMPSAIIDSHGISGVAAAGTFLDNLLSRADSVKKTAAIEPPLDKSDFDDVRRQLSDALGYELGAGGAGDSEKIQRFAVLETAARDTFKSLIVSWSPSCANSTVFGADRLFSPGNDPD